MNSRVGPIPPVPPIPPPRRRSRVRGLLKASLKALLLLIVVAVLGCAGWYGWQWRASRIAAEDIAARRVSQQLAEQQIQINRLQARLEKLAEATQQQSSVLDGLQSGASQSSQELASLREAIRGGGEKMQLVSALQLLEIAADRAQLAGDSAGGAQALGLAQERLGAIADPRLFEVRKAIAAEKAALDALPKTDIAGAALALGALIERSARLPLKNSAPVQFQPQPASTESFETGWRDRLQEKISHALNSIFTVRRTDISADQGLPVEAEGLTRELLMLKLEIARAALLGTDTASLRSALLSANAWLIQNYRADDPGVLAAAAEIERLQTLELRPDLPDQGRALGLLRARLDAADLSTSK